MAHNAKLAALTDELILSITSYSPATNRQAYRHAKEIASRGLRPHQYNRTNQFDVQRSCEGLVEKFSVLNRDDLADALGKRVSELDSLSWKWTPELLSLLLHLSDDAVNNSKVEALELLRPPPEPPELTWADIIADDPYSDEEIWKDIDYAAESSDDGRTPSRKEKTKAEKTPPTSPEEDDTYHPQSCVVLVNVEAELRKIQEAQFWNSPGEEETGRVEVTELQAVRETLFMLSGLQTSLYTIEQPSGNIHPSPKYTFSHAIEGTVRHLNSQLADIGRRIYCLRQWTSKRPSLALVQTFEAAVRAKVLLFDSHLASLQQRYLAPPKPIVVSLIEVHSEVRKTAEPLLQLASLVSDIEPLMLVNPFAHLEALYDRIVLAQMTLEVDVFENMAHIFFDCLQTYLKPIRKWMAEGELGANDETFFVFEGDSGSETSSLWHDRFVLRRGHENTLRAPKFLHPAAQKIFNTGKSVIFLKELGIHDSSFSELELESKLDYATVCGTGSGVLLSPFSELFSAAFETWIGSKYSLASTVLRAHLFTDCGLIKTLDAFKYLYLGADGSVFQDFADALFERMDRRQKSWNDRYVLTELAHVIFGARRDLLDASKIVARTLSIKDQGRSIKALSCISLDYALPWSIMNIIQRSSIPIYQQLFTFLLQTYRTKYLLQRCDFKALPYPQSKPAQELSYRLRHRFMWFADIMRTYLTESVSARATSELASAITKAEDIDEMSAIHLKHIARLQEHSLLADNLKPIHKAILTVLQLGTAFADNIALAERQTSAGDTRNAGPGDGRRDGHGDSAYEDSDSEDDEASRVGGSPPSEHKNKDVNEISTKVTDEQRFVDTLKSMNEQFGRLLPFVVAGLRSVSRAGGEPVWDMLADRLEWDKPRERYGG